MMDATQVPLVCPNPGGWVALCMAGCFDGAGGALTIAEGTRKHCQAEADQHHRDDVKTAGRTCPTCGRWGKR